MDVSRKFFIFFFLTLTLPASKEIWSHAVTPYGEVEEIVTMDGLHRALTSKTHAAIMLKMDHCPHCNALKPHFEKSAKNKAHKKNAFFVANGPRLQAAQTIKDLSKGTVKIPGFPSIIYVNNGKIVDWQIGGNQKTLEEKLTKLSKAN